MKKVPAIGLMIMLFALIGLPLAHGQSVQTSNQVLIFSTLLGNNQLLYVPVNSTGIQVYPYWNISLYGTGQYGFFVNNNEIKTGFIGGYGNFQYEFNRSVPTINAKLVYNGITYTFSNLTMDGALTDRSTQSIQISSYYPGQNQFLTVKPGTQAALMYPDWIVSMSSNFNESYEIFVNGQNVSKGSVLGSRTIEFNVSQKIANVTVVFGNSKYQYNHEIIASIPLQKYYGPAPAKDTYTNSEVENLLIDAFISTVFALSVAILVVYRFISSRRKRRAEMIF